MTDRFSQLTNLLGKSEALSQELLCVLIHDLGETPKIDSTEKHLWFYDFPQSGISLDFESSVGRFNSLTVWILLPPGPDGEISTGVPFSGNLPFNILRTDSRKEAEAKVPGCTMMEKDYRFDVDLRPLELTLHFDSPDGQRLHFVTVEYREQK